MGPRKADHPLKRISVFLAEDQLAALEAIHEATKVPTAVRIREGVDWVIAQYPIKRATKTRAKRR
jgi:ribbon-helix-helix protein